MVGLLDTPYIRNIMGAAMTRLYRRGRLIKIVNERTESGTLVPRALPVAEIRVQVARMDETMRSQQGYTQRAQLDFTDQDAKLLVLQAGVPYDSITTDDIVEVGDRRWRMMVLGEDSARAYWYGRGVRMAGEAPEWGWVFEFGFWDDTARWRADILQPLEGAAGAPAPLEPWTPQADAVGVLRAIAGGSPATWAELTDGLNAALVGEGMSPISDGESAALVRAKINAYVEALI